LTPQTTHALPRTLALTLALISSIVALFADASAQSPPAQPSPAAATPVRLELTLAGGLGRPSPELRREDVRVFVDGVERPVVLFEKEELPVSYGLVVDNSGSLVTQLGRVTSAAQLAVEGNRQGDRTFVVRFVGYENIRILQEMTDDKEALKSALGSMSTEGGATALLDALYLSGDYLLKNAPAGGAVPRRRALMLVSDGEDRNSYYKVEQVLKLLKGAGVQVFCVGLTGELDRQPGFMRRDKRGLARDLLSKLATETGGRALFAESPGELNGAVAEAVENMRTRYVVAYEPGARAAGKGRGKVEVKLGGAPAKEKLKAVVVTRGAAEAGGGSN
jgi:Ca-activated chloride channel family protein